MLTTCPVGPLQSACAEGSRHDFNRANASYSLWGDWLGARNCLATLPFSVQEKGGRCRSPPGAELAPALLEEPVSQKQATGLGGFGQEGGGKVPGEAWVEQ